MNKQAAFLIYGAASSGRDALAEEKYRDLGAAFSAAGFMVRSVLYTDDRAEQAATALKECDAILVWVNPVEQGNNRKKLDTLLTELSRQGHFVSAHPETILKIGTKDVLYQTKDMDWGSDIQQYSSYADFVNRFPASLASSGIRVLKQYRGNGGNGVFKIERSASAGTFTVTHAGNNNREHYDSWDDLCAAFHSFFEQDGLLIDQAWNPNMGNGMVRCYLSGKKVAGFGYQEINAMYDARTNLPPSKRYYFTEDCGLFKDLKEVMEKKWVPQLQKHFNMADNLLPVIWDADFFINDPACPNMAEKYTLCEINVSCVSPFPPSAINYIVEEVRSRLH